MVGVTYTHGHHESVLRSHRHRTAANSAAYLLPHLRPGMSVLDVGAGPGTITADLAALVAPGRVTALETSAQLAELSQAEAARRGLEVDVAVGDVTHLDLPDASIDVTHAHQVLQHLADPVQALREMARVTRPGGLVAVRDADYAAFSWYPQTPELDQWMNLYQRAARANGGEPDAGRRMLAWAHATGLRDLDATSSTWCFATPDDRAWWAATWAERLCDSALSVQLLTAGWATRADLVRIADGWTRWAADDDAWFTLVHGEILARR